MKISPGAQPSKPTATACPVAMPDDGSISVGNIPRSGSQTVEHACRGSKQRPATPKTLGFFACCPSGKRPWKAFSADS
jgi:hypothetical protein